MSKSLILFILISSFTLEMVAAESYCQAQRRVTRNACAMVAFFQSPSNECCLRIRMIPMRCVCPLITPQIAARVTARKLNYGIGVIRQCGRPVASGTKCGSKWIFSFIIIFVTNMSSTSSSAFKRSTVSYSHFDEITFWLLQALRLHELFGRWWGIYQCAWRHWITFTMWLLWIAYVLTL